MVRNMEVELGGDEPDYWVTLEVKDWIGQELRIEASKSPNVEQALNQCFCSETPKEENLFYKEPLRPKVHFTSRRGWFGMKGSGICFISIIPMAVFGVI